MQGGDYSYQDNNCGTPPKQRREGGDENTAPSAPSHPPTLSHPPHSGYPSHHPHSHNTPLKENGRNQNVNYAKQYSSPPPPPIPSQPPRNRYYTQPTTQMVQNVSYGNGTPILQQMVAPVRDQNQLIKEMFARKGLSLDHSVKLGSGKYSKVITAQTLSGQTLAIKMINKRKVTSEFRNKFLPREISCWKRLRHENIVRICGHYEALGYVFLLMEFGPGGDMLSYVQKHGPVAEQKAAFWMREICLAVEHMHDMDMAHRDLKLENIVICGNHVKIADFGFARKVNNELSHTFCGSKSYSAPEILNGQPYNPFKADIWSLGVISFVMCTDMMPYRENMSNHKIVESQKQRNYRFPTKLNLSAACMSSINDMMTFDATIRPTIKQTIEMGWIKGAMEGRDVHRYTQQPSRVLQQPMGAVPHQGGHNVQYPPPPAHPISAAAYSYQYQYANVNNGHQMNPIQNPRTPSVNGRQPLGDLLFTPQNTSQLNDSKLSDQTPHYYSNHHLMHGTPIIYPSPNHTHSTSQHMNNSNNQQTCYGGFAPTQYYAPTTIQVPNTQ